MLRRLLAIPTWIRATLLAVMLGACVVAAWIAGLPARNPTIDMSDRSHMILLPTTAQGRRALASLHWIGEFDKRDKLSMHLKVQWDNDDVLVDGKSTQSPRSRSPVYAAVDSTVNSALARCTGIQRIHHLPKAVDARLHGFMRVSDFDYTHAIYLTLDTSDCALPEGTTFSETPTTIQVVTPATTILWDQITAPAYRSEAQLEKIHFVHDGDAVNKLFSYPQYVGGIDKIIPYAWEVGYIRSDATAKEKDRVAQLAWQATERAHTPRTPKTPECRCEGGAGMVMFDDSSDYIRLVSPAGQHHSDIGVFFSGILIAAAITIFLTLFNLMPGTEPNPELPDVSATESNLAEAPARSSPLCRRRASSRLKLKGTQSHDPAGRL